MARILLYIREDINAKRIEDTLENSDIQHVLIEAGFGTGKHYIDMYYREWKSCVSGKNNQSDSYQLS